MTVRPGLRDAPVFPHVFTQAERWSLSFGLYPDRSANMILNAATFTLPYSKESRWNNKIETMLIPIWSSWQIGLDSYFWYVLHLFLGVLQVRHTKHSVSLECNFDPGLWVLLLSSVWELRECLLNLCDVKKKKNSKHPIIAESYREPHWVLWHCLCSQTSHNKKNVDGFYDVKCQARSWGATGPAKFLMVQNVREFIQYFQERKRHKENMTRLNFYNPQLSTGLVISHMPDLL